MRRNLLFATTLAFLTISMFASVLVMPVLAKPYQIVITIKDSTTGKPITDVPVMLLVNTVTGSYGFGTQSTDKQGKAAFDNWWGSAQTSSATVTSVEVRVFVPSLGGYNTLLTISADQLKSYSYKATISI